MKDLVTIEARLAKLRTNESRNIRLIKKWERIKRMALKEKEASEN